MGMRQSAAVDGAGYWCSSAVSRGWREGIVRGVERGIVLDLRGRGRRSCNGCFVVSGSGVEGYLLAESLFELIRK